MFSLIAVVFGVIALLDPENAPAMVAVGTGMALVLTIAFWLGSRIRKHQFEMRSGEIIVGTGGLLVNGVLHVWSAFLSWLAGAEIEKGPPPILTITYGVWGAYGPQFPAVMLPIGPGQMDLALSVQEELQRMLDKRGTCRIARAQLPTTHLPHPK
jgi:hypothetical protein